MKTFPALYFRTVVFGTDGLEVPEAPVRVLYALHDPTLSLQMEQNTAVE